MGDIGDACVDEELALALLAGRLSAVEVQRVEEHADRCSTCRTFLSALAAAASQPALPPVSPVASTDSDAPPSAFAAVPLFTRGDAIGRYLVLDRIGVGGMGVVYAAYDPELDRKVAVKLLRRLRGGQEVARARLIREAQALARLTHLNVVAIYDAGAWEDQVFLAMEFVEGGTVTEWLSAQPRSAREISQVYLSAGRGLSAAHAGGLVHRDFKPDNVLVGRDGRVLVTDFGLARDLGRVDDGEQKPSSPSSPATLTQTGAVLGTPGYMAPEQDQGRPADARSDQYSFCVALYEGLHGARPGQPLPTPSREVPARWQRILARGLQAAPEARYPSMDALLDELAVDLHARRRRAWAAAGAVLALAAAVTAPIAVSRRQSRLCSGGADRFSQVWNPSRRAQIRAAIVATHTNYAAGAAQEVDEVIERYRRDWVSMYTDACQATRLRGEQTESALGLRMECLSSRLDEIDVTANELARTDEKRVKRVIQAALGLTPLAQCADLAALSAPVRPPSDPQARARVEDMRKQLTEAKALYATGAYADSKKRVSALAETVHAVGYAPLEAEVLLQLGVLQARLEELSSARTSLLGSALAAEAGAHDEVAAAAWVKSVTVAADERHFDEGHQLARQADATVRRLRGRRPDLEAQLYRYTSDLWRAEGQYNPALSDGRRAVELSESRLGPEHLETAYSLGNLANVFGGKGDAAQALEYEERAGKIFFALFPPGHPQRDSVHLNLGVDLFNLGRFDEARQQFETMVAALDARGDHYSFDLAWPVGALGEIADRQGAPQRAIELFQRALAIRVKVLGEKHADNALDLRRIASMQLAMGKPREALATALRAVALLDAQKLTVPNLSFALALATDAQLTLGVPKQALALAERAITVGVAGHQTELERAPVQMLYAMALWENGDHARSRRLALEAQAVLGKAGGVQARNLKRLTDWLAAHSG